jgi:hypothetical protein
LKTSGRHEAVLLDNGHLNYAHSALQPATNLIPDEASIMSVRIRLDQPDLHFTNLDYLSGGVIVNFPVDAAVSAITVKLEGESCSRLAGPKQPNSNRENNLRTEFEWHRVSE